MKGLSFLGTGNYATTNYTCEKGSSYTRYFPVALYDIYAPDELIVFVTQGARVTHLDELSAELDAHAGWKWRPVEIPEGRSHKEMWQLFDTLVAQVENSDDVVLDVTHSFRSLQLLSASAAGYLRVAKNVRIHHILYGAYDARSAEQGTPIIDLQPFLSLLEWTAATDLFQRTGNAEPLAELLGDINDRLYRSPREDDDRPRRLKSAAGALEELSQAMRLVRPHEMMQLAATLEKRMGGVETEAAQWAKPFGVLLDQIRSGYAPFALAKPESEPVRDLQVQLRLISWYVDKGWWVEALALAREWIVSLACHRLGLYPLTSEGSRKQAEDQLNAAARASRPGTPDTDEPTPDLKIPARSDLAAAWGAISDPRNDLAHAGMRPKPQPAKTVARQIQALRARLAALLLDPAEPNDAAQALRNE